MERWSYDGFGMHTDSLGEYVLHREAEAEIEKARREERDLGRRDAMSEWTPYVTDLQAKARADERERIAKHADDMANLMNTIEWRTIWREVAQYCRTRDESKPPDTKLTFTREDIERATNPKPLERVTFPEGYNLMNAVNALVDAVNELRAKK